MLMTCTHILMPGRRVQALCSRLNKSSSSSSSSSKRELACVSNAAWGISQATLAWFQSAGALGCRPCKPSATSARQRRPLGMLLCMHKAQTEVCLQKAQTEVCLPPPLCCNDAFMNKIATHLAASNQTAGDAKQ